MQHDEKVNNFQDSELAYILTTFFSELQSHQKGLLNIIL